MNTDIAVVVSTWDKNKEIWKYCNYGIEKYWPDCQYIKYWISNYEEPPSKNYIPLKIGDETDWVLMTKIALSKIKEKCIIWMLEDYWLTYVVNCVKIQEYADIILSNQVKYIKLLPSNFAVFNTDYSDLKEYPLDCEYKTSLGPSIWNKSLLERLLVFGENIWQFEQNSPSRTNPNEKFYSTTDNSIFRIVCSDNGSGYIQEPMEKGKLTPAAYQYIIKEGLK